MDLHIDRERTTPCSREILARSPIGSVERCTCGALHLSIGALSLRLDPNVLRAIVVMGHEALGQLERDRTRERVRASA